MVVKCEEFSKQIKENDNTVKTNGNGVETRKKRVFVSHPYKDDPIGNKEKVEEICRNLTKNGVLPISPVHLFAFMDNDDEREEILKMCYEMIGLCDEVWVYGQSSGCLAEKKYAESIGKTVRILF